MNNDDSSPRPVPGEIRQRSDTGTDGGCSRVRPAERGARLWGAAAWLCAVGVFALAVSHEIYIATSPPALSFHVLLRKSYSLAAFALVAALADRASRAHGMRPPLPILMAWLGAYSGLIEVAQWLAGSHEGLSWNAIAVLFGLAGGGLGWWGARRWLHDARAPASATPAPIPARPPR
jgi:hypothetical protein